jgi:adenosylcobyric acid synthase
VNLRPNDIANMGFARAAGVPVILLGDIDRGGVIAQIVGTKAVIAPEDAALVRGFLVNKFRGDPELFTAGMAVIEAHTEWPGLGLIPHFPDAGRLPAEDAMALRVGRDRRRGGDRPVVVVPVLPCIANFDDFDPLRLEPGVELVMAHEGAPLPPGDLVVLPGSKATIADLETLRSRGWDIDILAHARRGGRVFGICGGYQMLGRMIADPHGLEGPPAVSRGLGLLDVETVLAGDKTLRAVAGATAGDGAAFHGYEMHVGETSGPDRARPLLRFDDGGADGAVSPDGRVAGAYVHGLFGHAAQRSAWLRSLGASESAFDYDATVEATLDALAEHLERHADLDRLLTMAQ